MKLWKHMAWHKILPKVWLRCSGVAEIFGPSATLYFLSYFMSVFVLVSLSLSVCFTFKLYCTVPCTTRSSNVICSRVSAEQVGVPWRCYMPHASCRMLMRECVCAVVHR